MSNNWRTGASPLLLRDNIMGLIANFSAKGPGKSKMTREELIGLIGSDAKFMNERDEIAEYISTLKAGEGLSETAIRDGYIRFKAEKNAKELAAIAAKHSISTAALQTFLDCILERTLQEIKVHLRSSRIRAILAANPIVIEAYWQTGKIILARQQEAGLGAKVIDRLAEDLQAEFPDMSGLTARNLLSMKIFAREFPDGPIAKQPVSQLPWGQIIRLMQIQNQLHLRLGKAQKIEVQGTSTTRILTVSNSRPLEIRLVSTASRSFVRNCLRKNGCGS